MKPIAVLLAAAALASAAGCGSSDEPASTGAASSALPTGTEPVTLDPAEFTNRIDNPYWPMKPGSRWVYRETEAKGTSSGSSSRSPTGRRRSPESTRSSSTTSCPRRAR